MNKIISIFAVLFLISACSHHDREFEDITFSSDEKNALRQASSDSVGNESALDDFLNTEINKEDALLAEKTESGETKKTLPDWDELIAKSPEPVPAPMLASNNPPAEVPEANTNVTDAPSEAGSVPPTPVQVPSLSQPPAATLKKDAPVKKQKSKALQGVYLPKKVVRKNGVSLNRYYFARKGDSPESVSQIIYGSTEHAKELVAWNGKKWSPGKLLLYVSSWQPDDSEFLSFYDEQGITPETYVLKPGEKLKTVAEQRYGDKGSWREIALLNKRSHEKAFKEGMEIALYPSNPSGIKIRDVAELAFASGSTAKLETLPAIEDVPRTGTISLPKPPEDAEAFKKNRVSERKRKQGARLASPELPVTSLFNFALWGFLITSGLCLVLVWQYRKAKADAEFLED